MGVELKDIRAAARRIRDDIHRTPVQTSQYFDRLLGMQVFFKCENLQKAGAFKIRGATNAIRSLPPEAVTRGVVTHSSGNHAQAVALAARRRGVPAWVVMPTDAPLVKRKATERYGATIVPCEPTLEAREFGAKAVIEETGAAFVHPYDDERIIAGQGTAALELMDEVENLDVLIAPVGGGGLLSGTALCAHGKQPWTKVYGAEPAGADDAHRSFEAGRLIMAEKVNTIADGLKTSLSELTFSIIQEHVEAIPTVGERDIVRVMAAIFERMKLVVEPSAAVAPAALFHIKNELKGKRVGVILSGGNVDLRHLPWK